MQECVLIFSLIVSISSNPILNTTSGVYRGRLVRHENRTVEQFLGIQYAQIPRRFHRARLIEKQNEMMVNATDFGPICKPVHGQCTIASNITFCSLTYGIFSVNSLSVEQCLYLNIFKPTSQSNRKRAIFMWIHGGSGQIGTGNLFDGTILAALGDLIVESLRISLVRRRTFRRQSRSLWSIVSSRLDNEKYRCTRRWFSTYHCRWTFSWRSTRLLSCTFFVQSRSNSPFDLAKRLSV